MKRIVEVPVPAIKLVCKMLLFEMKWDDTFDNLCGIVLTFVALLGETDLPLLKLDCRPA